MHLKRLRSFVVTAEAQSVGRAAQRLHVAQPALSRQLRTLEREVGAKLLERHARGVRLTPAGLVFLDSARALLAAADAAVQSAREAAARSRLDVVRVSPPDWPNRARPVQRAVAALRQTRPSLEIEYDVTPWLLHGSALLEGTMDVGFGIGMSPSDFGDGITAHRLIDEPASSAIIPKSHPLARRSSVTLRDLRDIPMLVPSREIAPILHEQMLAAVRSGGYEPRVVPGPASFAFGVQLVIAGAGWIITTNSVGEEPPHDAAVVPIEDAQLMLGFYALRRTSDDRVIVHEFIERVRDALVAQAGERAAIGG